MLSDKEKKRRKTLKELKSFRNKMGSNIVWFDSLNKQKQFDLLFEWKREKYSKRFVENPYTEKKRVLVLENGRWRRKLKDVTIYPASLKHFIKRVKPKYRPNVVKVRETTIDMILKNND